MNQLPRVKKAAIHKINFFKQVHHSKQGFTLIEILIALFLVALVISISLGIGTGADHYLEESKNIKRALRFASDESNFKNSTTRIHFKLSDSPQSYAPEYGPSSQFVLPAKVEESISTTDEELQKLNEKLNKDLNSRFTPLNDFHDGPITLYEDFKIVGIGFPENKQLITSGEVSIYFYPSGENDAAIIIFGNEEGLMTVSLSTMGGKFSHQFYSLTNGIINNETTNKSSSKSEDPLYLKAKEIFEEWQKKSH